MGNRSAEVLANTNFENIYHICSKQNVSDLATRANATVEDISPGSDWHDGSMWMQLPRYQWPLTEDFSGSAVP